MEKNVGHNKKNTAPFGRYSFLGMRNPNQKNFVFGFKTIVLCVMQLSEVKGKEATESASITEQILLTRTEFFENWSL